MTIFHKLTYLPTTATINLKSCTAAFKKLLTTSISWFYTTITAAFSSTFSSSLCSSLDTRKMIFIRQSLLIFLVALFILCTLQIDLIRGAFEDGNNNIVKVTKQSLELTQTINLQRQEYLQKHCDTLGYSRMDINNLTAEQMDHMIVDQEHKLLYCYVPKVSKGVCLLMPRYLRSVNKMCVCVCVCVLSRTNSEEYFNKLNKNKSLLNLID